MEKINQNEESEGKEGLAKFEQLQRALSIVAHIDDEAFEQRAPLLFKHFSVVRSYTNKQEVAYEHATLLHEYLYNKALRDEIVALIA